MITKSTRIAAMLVPVLLLLTQLAVAHHFHCADSFHDEQDVLHASCTAISDKCAETLSDTLFIATLSDVSFSSPVVLQGELASVDFPGHSPEVFNHFIYGRPPPV